ncbi:CPBP family intramembrane metalloprotease [Legionella qingyii]|uniref:CPBP family intramembrane metalloprotease n=1 Tax=Legionella qingyii TaxID=2184757 RepID=A0A317U2F3_9GAMM|nr:CPBP family intramembrane metalloprotease [Legionella qingyii]PWY54561.1 CPBP family intramembrane metalloprotease [Legionella qingyii]PWY55539.1 CPBP family intramembrane metalloprotease [Legionella qingyii]RUR21453.1 CPBP family intramembrane metalloprotease [Legionella qingyii]RUR24728.1 CPBP family intramembrane metalloprotease [Legionella qingyii]
MTINWPVITVLFCLSIPGVVIAIKRLIYFLLPDNSEELKKRMSRFAILQTLFMIFILSFAGAVLSPATGLHDTKLEALLQGTAGISVLLPILLPTVLYAFFGLMFFLVLYYGLIARIIDKNNMKVMTHLRTALGVDGCVLYGGVAEEIIGRWGLMNLATFFALLFTKQFPNLIIWISMLISGLVLAISQLPAYLAAGCTSNRRFIYSLITLSLCQSLLFGYLFWQHGLIAAILAHMLFHIGWAAFENVKKS